ncbi:glutaredoxin [Serratia marcescens]|uniref:Glutaredoxin n=1 Tax=Serratia marcescens TaxID=615 RepID=A0A939NKS9_SERMA|nr:glutaredoxin [Serratia marcescens]
MLNDDETTPVNPDRRKNGADLVKDDGESDAGSLDIVRYVDRAGRQASADRQHQSGHCRVAAAGRQLQRQNCCCRVLRMPISKEFATGSAAATLLMKQAAIGDFAEHLANSADLIAELEADLQTLSPLIVSTDAVNGELSEDDIHLFPLLLVIDRRRSCAAGQREAYRNRMAQRSECRCCWIWNNNVRE